MMDEAFRHNAERLAVRAVLAGDPFGFGAGGVERLCGVGEVRFGDDVVAAENR